MLQVWNAGQLETTWNNFAKNFGSRVNQSQWNAWHHLNVWKHVDGDIEIGAHARAVNDVMQSRVAV